MLLLASIEDAPPREVAVTGQTYTIRELIGKAPVRGTYVAGNESNDNGLPQGFLVHQPPQSITRAHFHETNQFQVFIAGAAHFGKQAVAPVTVQYASGHTPYGPIRAGAQGVEYYTLRQTWDPGAKYMPQMRAGLVRGRQRQHLVAGISLPEPGQRDCTAPPEVVALLPGEPDGLGASLLSLAPGQQTSVPDPMGCGGQYLVVLKGDLTRAARNYPARSCLFADASEGTVTVTAGNRGLALLSLRFPRPVGA